MDYDDDGGSPENGNENAKENTAPVLPFVTVQLLPDGNLNIEISNFPTAMLLGVAKIIEIHGEAQWKYERTIAEQQAQQSQLRRPSLLVPNRQMRRRGN